MRGLSLGLGEARATWVFIQVSLGFQGLFIIFGFNEKHSRACMFFTTTVIVMGTCVFLELVQLVTQLRICTPKITTINFQGLGSTRFISWNIKEIQHPIKRNRVFARLKTLGADIMYLQETHLRNNE